jgi:predicted transcriptional regulator
MTLRPLRAVAVGACLVALSSCAGTTYDESLESTTSVPATSTTIPTGTLPELVRQMADEVASLGSTITNKGDDRAIVARVEALWAVAEPLVVSEFPDLIEEFDTTLNLVREASEENRSADAEKAYRNFKVLADAVD